MNDSKKTIDFRFAKNWKAFLSWHEYHASKHIGKSLPWEFQEKKIQDLFESCNPHVVNWTALWTDFATWAKQIMQEKGGILWSEQQRQIETLMLNQAKELNQENFILVFLHKGTPNMSSEKMTYWDAQRSKENLQGDNNGRGGDENLDKITIINLNALMK